MPSTACAGRRDGFHAPSRPFLGERHAVLVLDDEGRGVVFHVQGGLTLAPPYLAAKDRLALRAS